MSKQNTGRKFFATAATAALVASAIVPIASAADFKDADNIASWAKEAIETLTANEVISGNPDGTFAPQGNVTRAQAAKMFTVALGLSTEGTEEYTDVNDGQWYQEYIVAVSKAGIVNGMGAGSFAPNNNLTREEAAKMIVEAYSLKGEAELFEFADANSVAGKWSEAYLSTAVANGVINGKGDKLAASDSISRQEFAVMLTRAIEASQDNSAELIEVLNVAIMTLENAVKALNTEVKSDEISEAKAEVLMAQEAIITVEAALEIAKEVVSEADATKVTVAIEKAKKAIEVTELVIAEAEENAKEFAVESVTVRNASKLEVKFNKMVDEAAAENRANYVLVGLNTLDASLAILGYPELQKDGKTVVVTLVTPIKNDSTLAIIVNPIALKDDSNKLTKRFSTSINFNDTEKPTFVGTENNVAGEVKLKFSEEINAATIIPANIQVLKAGVPQTVKTSAAAAGEILLTGTADGFKLSGLEKNVDYTVHAVNLKDLVGNLTSPNLITTTVKSTFTDNDAPVASDITTTSLNTVVVKVNEKLQDVSAIPGTTPAKYLTLSGVVATADAQVYDAENGTVTVKIIPVNEADVKTIIVAGYKDLVGNVGVAFTKTVNFTKLSTVTKTEVISKLNYATPAVVADFIKVTFDKDITVNRANLLVTLKTAENVVKTLTIPANNVRVGTGTETNVLYLELTGLIGIEAGTLSINLPKTVVTTLVADKVVDVNYTPTDANAPKVATKIAATSTSEKLTVKFDQDMDQTALDVNNYTVDGIQVFESAFFLNDKKTVVLTFKKGAVVLDGTYDFAISTAVKAENGIAIKEPYTEQVILKENVAPTIVSAKIVNNGSKIEVTFSEAVTDGPIKNEDYDVYVDGVKYSVATTTASAKVVTLTLNPTLNYLALSKTITIKALETLDIRDLNGNKAVTSFDIVVSK